MGSDLMSEEEENRRKRLYLTKKIKNDLAESHRREQEYMQRQFDLLDYDMQRAQSLPNKDPTKKVLLNHYNNIYDIQSNYWNQKSQSYSRMNSMLEESIRDIIYNETECDDIKYAKKIIKSSVSTTMGFVPILGNAKGIVEAIIGKDLITDEELSTLSRIYAGASSLPIIGDFIGWENWVKKILEKLFAL